MRWGKWKLQILYYLVNILIGDIRNLFLVIYGEQIDAGVVRLHSDNKRNNSHPAALTFPFAFYGKSNLVFSPHPNQCLYRDCQSTHAAMHRYRLPKSGNVWPVVWLGAEILQYS